MIPANHAHTHARAPIPVGLKRSKPVSALMPKPTPRKVQSDEHRLRAEDKLWKCLEILGGHMTDNGVSKSDLSRLMNCYPSFVQAIFDEREGRGLTLQTLERVADALNYDVTVTVKPKPPVY